MKQFLTNFILFYVIKGLICSINVSRINILQSFVNIAFGLSKQQKSYPLRILNILLYLNNQHHYCHQHHHHHYHFYYDLYCNYHHDIIQGKEQWLCFAGAAVKRNPSKTVGVARGHQRANTPKPYSQKTSQSNHTTGGHIAASRLPACPRLHRPAHLGDASLDHFRSDSLAQNSPPSGDPLPAFAASLSSPACLPASPLGGHTLFVDHSFPLLAPLSPAGSSSSILWVPPHILRQWQPPRLCCLLPTPACSPSCSSFLIPPFPVGSETNGWLVLASKEQVLGPLPCHNVGSHGRRPVGACELTRVHPSCFTSPCR